MYRTIDARFWTDPKVRDLMPKNKLLFLYLITSPHAHFSGLYYMPETTVVHETGIKIVDVRKGIDTLRIGYLIRIDRVSDLIWVVNMFHYQSHSKKLLKNIETHLMELHNSPLIGAFLEHYSDLEIPYRYPIDTLCDKEQEQEQRKEQIQGKEEPSSENGGESYMSKKERKLKGDKLAWFIEFMNAFGYKSGKAAAADSWLDIKGLTRELVDAIVVGARKEAIRRATLRPDQTAIMAQGWLTARRWEDDYTPSKNGGGKLTEKEKENLSMAHDVSIYDKGRRGGD